MQFSETLGFSISPTTSLDGLMSRAIASNKIEKNSSDVTRDVRKGHVATRAHEGCRSETGGMSERNPKTTFLSFSRFYQIFGFDISAKLLSNIPVVRFSLYSMLLKCNPSEEEHGLGISNSALCVLTRNGRAF